MLRMHYCIALHPCRYMVAVDEIEPAVNVLLNYVHCESNVSAVAPCSNKIALLSFIFCPTEVHALYTKIHILDCSPVES